MTYYIGPFQIEPFPLEHRGWCCGFILTNPHDKNQKKVVVSSDTIPCSSLKTALQGADIAVLEAAFPGDPQEIAHNFHHTTEAEAIQLTKDVPHVYLYHQLPIQHIREYLAIKKP